MKTMRSSKQQNVLRLTDNVKSLDPHSKTSAGHQMCQEMVVVTDTDEKFLEGIVEIT